MRSNCFLSIYLSITRPKQPADIPQLARNEFDFQSMISLLFQLKDFLIKSSTNLILLKKFHAFRGKLTLDIFSIEKLEAKSNIEIWLIKFVD